MHYGSLNTQRPTTSESASICIKIRPWRTYIGFLILFGFLHFNVTFYEELSVDSGQTKKLISYPINLFGQIKDGVVALNECG